MGHNMTYTLLLIWQFCQKLKNVWHFDIFVNTGPYGAGISKRYSSCSFHRMSTKRYEGIGCHGGIKAFTLLGNRPSFENW